MPEEIDMKSTRAGGSPRTLILEKNEPQTRSETINSEYVGCENIVVCRILNNIIDFQ